MQKNRRILITAGTLVLLAASLEENAHAEQNKAKVQTLFETTKTAPAGTDPSKAIGGWNVHTPVQNLKSKTSPVQSNGFSALEALKKQNHQLVRSLRTTNEVSEGRFEPPGLYEFSSYMSRTKGDGRSVASREENIDALRIATIQSIEKLLKQSPSQNQRIDLLLRLAELHAERYTYFLVREMTQYEQAHDKWVKNHRSGAEPKLSQVQAHRAVGAATEILRNLVNQYPNHQRTPDALYQLGFLLTELRSDSGALYFQRLIERFPRSKFIPDAQLALGEFYFSRNRFADAQVYYQKLLNDRNHRVYPYAVYKLGWTFFNIRGNEQETQINLQKSLTAFKLLVRFTQEADSRKKLEQLRKDALRDMVLVYADLGDVEEAQRYFKSVNEYSLYTTLLERLAWLHAEGGRYRESAEIYSRLIQEFPNNSKNPQYYARLASIYDKEQQRPRLVETMEQFSEIVTQGSAWWKAQNNQTERDSAKNLLASESQLWALRLHAEFQKSKNKPTAQQAQALYQIVLQHQGASSASYTAQFNKAQLHTVLEEHEKAVEGYVRVAWLDKKYGLNRPETKMALENAIAESDILIQQRGNNGSAAKGQIPALEQRLVKLIDQHAAMFPKDSERVGLLHRAALIHFNSGLVDHATRRWAALAKEFPQHAFVSEGLRLVIKRSYDAQDWIKASSDARAFLNIAGVHSAPLGTQLRKLLSVAMFQQGLHLEKSRRHAEASKQFLAFHKEFPSDSDAGKALINAANNQFKDNRPEDALLTLKLFTDNFPNSEYLMNALEMTATTSEALGLYADAAKAIETIALRRKAGETSGQAYAHAAGLRLSAGDPHRAVSNATSALTHLKKAQDVCETYKVLLDAQTLIRSGALQPTAVAALNRCQNTSPEWGLYFGGLAARLTQSSGQSAEAFRLASQTLTRGRNVSSKLQNPYAFEGLRLAGQVQLGILEAQSRQLLNRKLRSTAALQVDFVSIKADAEQLVQKYVQLAQVGQPESSVGAIYRVAEIQEGLASILVQAPHPQGMPPAEGEALRARIEKIAIPLQEEAAKLYVQALSKAEDMEVVSPYTNMLKEKLSLIRPAEFRKMVEVMPSPSYFVHELPIREEVKEVVDEQK